MKYVTTFFLFFVSQLFALEFTNSTQLPIPFFNYENLYFDKTNFFVIEKTPHREKNIDLNRGYKILHESPSYGNENSVLDGTTILIMDVHPGLVFHFFHLLEHLAGIWAFYGDEHSSDVKRFVFVGMNDPWEGPNQIHKHLINALFPAAQVMTWDHFRNTCKNGLVRLERAVISDRGLSIKDPSCIRINKHLGAALPFIHPKNMQGMADVIHAYAQTIPKTSQKLRITYIKRPPPRCLTENVEKEMIKKISALPNVTLKTIDFAAISFCEQINIIGNTDVLISVHGNGLSHTLFLPPHACLIEIFPPNTHHLDFRLFSEIHGITYFGLLYNEHKFINNAYDIGAYGTPNSSVDKLDINLITSAIKSRY